MAESLDDLVQAIQYAVIEAQKVAEDHHIDLVSRFFEEDEDTGELRAIIQEVWVPSMSPNATEGEHVKINVPLISLANLGSVKIKELKVEFDARLSSLDTEDDDDDADVGADVAKKPGGGKVSRKKTPKPSGSKPKKQGPFQKRLRGKRRRMAFDFKKGADAAEGESTKARISITFQGTDPPEGVVRLNDRILKMIP